MESFELKPSEISANKAVGKEQIDMIERLVIFVNESLSEIELQRIELDKAKQDITDLTPK
tara:strand:+ start:3648 stop:3827 length:180 start_codon:yes stop_codon:yes gene_type:complete